MSSVDRKMLLVGDRPCRALVVDDIAQNRMLLELMLTEAGADVAQAEDGQKACEAFVRNRFDVVLMDIQMPVVDGLTATRVIRQLEAERRLKRTPIIVVSAHVGSQDVAN